MKKLLLILAAFLSLHGAGNAQCCAVGSPVSGTTNVGTVGMSALRVSGYFKYGMSDQYYKGTKPDNIPGSIEVDKMDFQYSGISLAYGITDRMTIEAELGYYFSKSQKFKLIDNTLSSSGLSNGGVSVKYNILNEAEHFFDLTLGGGVKIPFSQDPIEQDGVVLPVDLQTSTRAFGLLFHGFVKKHISWLDANAIMINRTEINFKNSSDYTFGNSYSTSLSLSKALFENCTGILQLRNDIREKDKVDGKDVPAPSGSFLVVLSPQLGYAFGNLSISVLADIPLYRNYYQRQIANKFGAGLSMTYLLHMSSED